MTGTATISATSDSLSVPSVPCSRNSGPSGLISAQAQKLTANPIVAIASISLGERVPAVLPGLDLLAPMPAPSSAVLRRERRVAVHLVQSPCRPRPGPHHTGLSHERQPPGLGPALEVVHARTRRASRCSSWASSGSGSCGATSTSPLPGRTPSRAPKIVACRMACGIARASSSGQLGGRRPRRSRRRGPRRRPCAWASACSCVGSSSPPSSSCMPPSSSATETSGAATSSGRTCSFSLARWTSKTARSAPGEPRRGHRLGRRPPGPRPGRRSRRARPASPRPAGVPRHRSRGGGVERVLLGQGVRDQLVAAPARPGRRARLASLAGVPARATAASDSTFEGQRARPSARGAARPPRPRGRRPRWRRSSRPFMAGFSSTRPARVVALNLFTTICSVENNEGRMTTGSGLGPRAGAGARPLSTSRAAILDVLRDQPEPLTQAALVARHRPARQHRARAPRRPGASRAGRAASGPSRRAAAVRRGSTQLTAVEPGDRSTPGSPRPSPPPSRAPATTPREDAAAAGEEWGHDLVRDRAPAAERPRGGAGPRRGPARRPRLRARPAAGRPGRRAADPLPAARGRAPAPRGRVRGAPRHRPRRPRGVRRRPGRQRARAVRGAGRLPARRTAGPGSERSR